MQAHTRASFTLALTLTRPRTTRAPPRTHTPPRSFDSISVDGIPPVFQDFVTAGMLDDNVFGFYLESDWFHTGELEIGGIDPAHFTGTMQWFNLTSDTYWETRLDGLSVGGVPATNVTKAVFDTGTSLLAGPVAEVQKIAAQVGAVPLIEGEYTVDCSKVASMPDITITVGGADFVLTAKDYVLNVLDEECVLGLVGIDIPAPAGPLWIMGDVFQRKYYAAYRWPNPATGVNAAVGIAPINPPPA